jgi:23S rRNA pseudouridine955/2504/2580 synthase/23S rRNA pseudouridine1911/1915/1917 synthase
MICKTRKDVWQVRAMESPTIQYLILPSNFYFRVMSIKINVTKHLLLEDEFFLVINKPATLMVEPDRNGHPNLLQQVQRYLRNKIPKGEEIYAQHIHRLDRPVSGIVLFAKQRSVLKNLSEQFAERRVKKFYQALTSQAPATTHGTLEHWHRKEKKKAAIYESEIAFSEQASLSYRVNKVADDKFLWDIELKTGKFHQIRAQLAHLHCPIIGDTLYGSTAPYHEDAIALHASKLVFFHPITDKVIVVNAPGLI